MDPSIKKILVVVLDNIGDAVMATAVLKPLKRLYPHASIGFWTKQYAGDLFVDQSSIEVLHTSDPFWDKSPGQKKGLWTAFWKTLIEIRKEKYDLAVILNADWRRSLCVKLAGVPIRIGLTRKRSRFFLTQYYSSPSEELHFVQDHLLILESWSGQAHPLGQHLPRLELNQEEKKIWEEWSGKTGWKTGSYIVVHPFSGDELKNWPVACWSDLLSRLSSRRKKCRFLFISSLSEKNRLDSLLTNLSKEEVQAMAGSNLRMVKALIGNSSLLIGGDSGPGHIAAALGVPVVSLFGNTKAFRSRPLGHSQGIVIEKNNMRDIPVRDVEEAVVQILENNKKLLPTI